MGLVTAKLEETAAHVVALSILLLNLRKIQCAFCNFWIGYSDFCNRVKTDGYSVDIKYSRSQMSCKPFRLRMDSLPPMTTV